MFRKQLAQFAIALFLVVSTPCSYADAALEGCEEYAEYGIPGNNGTLLYRKGYLLAHDSARKTPIWVAERLTCEKASTALARTNNFRPDPDLEVGKRAELSDYKRSGYDKGHMAPAGDMRWDQQAIAESLPVEYGAADRHRDERGIWKDLEEKIRRWAVSRGAVFIYS